MNLKEKLKKIFWSHRNKSASARRVYLDYAAATPMLPEAVTAMEPFFESIYGNPSAIHNEGRLAREAVETARQTVATVVGVRPELVIFTSGGTESNNIGILGYLQTLHSNGRAYDSMEVLTTTIEHPATTESLQIAVQLGVRVKYLPLTADGLVDSTMISSVVSERTVLVTVAHVNSELGSVQPVAAIAKTLRLLSKQNFWPRALLHVDAAQSPLWLSVQAEQLGADMVSLDGGKCGGPKGIGALVCARTRWVQTGVLYGGGQEYGVRPGTEAVAQVVAFSVALQHAQKDWKERSQRVKDVRDQLHRALQSKVPELILNGPNGGSRVCNNLNFSLPGFDTEFLALVLDRYGFAVSTKSACGSQEGGGSEVVRAVYHDNERAQSTLRITLGPDTDFAELAPLVTVIRNHVDQMSVY